MAKLNLGHSLVAIEAHVGARIRERRVMLGLTQRQLGEAIGVSSVQMRKYECGLDRISAGRLYWIARELGAPLTYFYEGLMGQTGREQSPHERGLRELAGNFSAIENVRYQEALSQITRALAGR